MKIDGVLVIYNPQKEMLDNIQRYYPLLSSLFVIDNSITPNHYFVEEVKKLDKVTYLSLEGNKGIAKALKEGLLLAIEDQADYCLTIDQDSLFPLGKEKEIKEYLSKDNGDYGIISLNFNSDTSEKEIKEVDTWIASGNFINIKNYQLISGFKEELFIDWVDFDLDEQFHSIGKKIGVIQEISLSHQIGEPLIRRFLWKKFPVDNHLPVRYYYLYRNAEILHRNNKTFYKRLYKGLKRDYIIQLIFGVNRKEKLKMISRGKRDGKKGILGPYKEAK